MKKIILFFNKIINWIVIFCVIGMVVVIFSQVICRYIFKSPLSWSEELARYLFVWITFLGAAICAREKGHIGMDYLVNKLNLRLAKIVEKLGLILIIIVCAIITITSLETVSVNLGQRSPALNLNMGMVYLAIPIGFTYSTFYYIMHLFGKSDLIEKE